MRPERLVIEGLTAFRERQEIDFRELDVFTITGPTGAGKTSIFDAMSLALYGRIPRVGTSAQVRRFISHGASEVFVSLEFLVDDSSYRVSRRYRAASSVSDVVLERLDNEGGPIELASGQRAATTRITELVGMDYEAFQRAVLLPQGQFDLFLAGDPAERRAVLIRLLDLERYVEAGRRAREQAREIAATVAAHDARLGALEHATAQVRRERIRQRDAAISVGAAAAEQLRRARDDRAKSLAALELARQLERDGEEWSGLATHVDDLARDARSSQEEAASAEAEAAASRAALAGADARVAERERERASVVERVGTAEQHAVLESEIEGRRRALARIEARSRELAEAREEENGAAAALADFAPKAVRPQDVLEHVRSARIDAEHENNALVRRDLAAALRAHIHVGDDCPVCERPLEREPAVDRPGEESLLGGQRVLDAARARETEATAAFATLQRASAARDGAERVLADAKQELAQVMARLGTVLEPSAPADPGDVLRARRSELAAAEEALGAAQTAARAARERREQALDELSRRVAADRTRQHRAGELRGRAEALLARADTEKSWPELGPLAWPAGVDALGDDMPRQMRARAQALSQAARAARGSSESAEGRIAQLAAGIEGGEAPDNTDPLDALSRAHEAAIVAAAEAERELALLEKEIAERSEIEKARDAKRLRVERLQWVASHLRDDDAGFLAFVIGESLETLCELASARLEQMSEHRYALQADTDGSFQVIDAANAGERRDVETLSGGETFLVSFALALALSESITNYGDGHGALLEAIFIDEGFSALDSNSLEVALDALETLGHAEQRMIGLVSHVERVPERIPEGIDVIKSVGSSRIVKRHGVADSPLLPA